MIHLDPANSFSGSRCCSGCGEFSVVAVLVVNDRVKLRLCAACVGTVHEATADRAPAPPPPAAAAGGGPSWQRPVVSRDWSAP